MSDPFDNLIPEARVFLAELAQNNNRDWFNGNKDRYVAQLKKPALLLAEQISMQLETLTGFPSKPKLFRPQRDVRFSKDKTPYHTHLHLLWLSQGGGPQDPGWFFGISPDYVSIGGGIMQFDKAALQLWRNFVDLNQCDTISGQLLALSKDNFRISEPELKRVPPPYEKTHPQADLLRRKSLTCWRDLQPPISGLCDVVTKNFHRIWPLQQALMASLKLKRPLLQGPLLPK